MLYLSLFFFFNDTATTEIYTLSLHDALPISGPSRIAVRDRFRAGAAGMQHRSGADRYRRPQGDRRVLSHRAGQEEHVDRLVAFGIDQRHFDVDRKSTRLNSSHGYISYAVFCL